jgi:hypothetical protein
MTGRGDWRVVHVGPGGVLTDALANSPNPPADAESSPLGVALKPRPTGAAGPDGIGEEPQPVLAPIVPPLLQNAAKPADSDPSGSDSSSGQSTNAPPGAPRTSPPSPSPKAASPPTPQIGGGLAGVASRSTATGIMVYNGRTRYDEWEFVYDLTRGTTRAPLPNGSPGMSRAPASSPYIRRGQP